MAKLRNKIKLLRLIRGRRRLLRWSRKLRKHSRRLTQTETLEETDSRNLPKLRVEALPNLKLTTTQATHQWVTSALSEMILVLETMAGRMLELESQLRK